MKTFMLIVLTIMLAGCTGSGGDTTRDFIPGMYIRFIEHEYATGSDTLIIRHLQDNMYEIAKRSGVVPIRNGKPLPFKHNKEIWTGIYDEKDGVLREQQKGKIISFIPNENKLLVGASAYQKVI